MRKFVLLAVLLAACSVKAEIVGPDTPVISNPESCHPMIVPMGDVYRYLYAPRVMFTRAGVHVAATAAGAHRRTGAVAVHLRRLRLLLRAQLLRLSAVFVPWV